MADEYSAPEGLPEDIEPLTVAETAVPTIYGEELFTGGDSDVTHDGTSDLIVSGGIQLADATLQAGLATAQSNKFALAGLYNSDFSLGPPNPSEPISENNPLPFWRYGNYSATGGTPVPLYWVADSTAPGGYAIRAQGSYAFNPTNGSGTSYIEQVVPVAPRQRVLMPIGIFSWDDTIVGGGSGQRSYGQVYIGPFDSTGAQSQSGDSAAQGVPAANSAASLHLDPNDPAFIPYTLPADTRYALVRFEFVSRTDSGEATPETLSLREASCLPPKVRYATISFYYSSIPASGNVTWLTGAPFTTGGARQYFPPAPGWVESISMNIAGARTGGTLLVQLNDADTGNCLGPYLRVNAAHVGNATPKLFANGKPNDGGSVSANPGDYDDYNWFKAGTTLRIQSLSTGTFAPTNLDAVCWVTLALIDERFYDNENHP